MMSVVIDKKNPTPIYQQIVDNIVKLIDEGNVEVGEPLPSTRTMAQILGLDHSTVNRAYQELQVLGYVECAQGSYAWVRKKPELLSPSQGRESTIQWADISSDRSDFLYKTFLKYSPEYPAPRKSNGVINLSQLDLDSRLFPVEDFRQCMDQVLTAENQDVLGYGLCFGYPPLRETITNRLRNHGISISPNEILITNGAQQAFDLIFKLLTQPDKKVAIESPTYANILPLLKFYQVHVVEIPMQDDGLNLDFFERSMRSNPPCFVYTIPNSHNPTGISTPQKHREELLLLCKKYCVPIVEDGFEDEIKYFGKVMHPIKSMDDEDIVIYIGTVSKVLFPGIRIGWIAAHEKCIQRLTAIKRFTDISTNHVTQRALDQFFRMGYYDNHLRRLRRVFRKRMKVAVQAMKEHLPIDVSWTRPIGGYSIWIRLNCHVDEAKLKEIMLKHGVLVSHGSYYFYKKDRCEFFRVSIAKLNEEEIEQGITRLGLAVQDLKEKVVGYNVTGVA